MPETSYQKVFEVIQSSLIPKSQYDELQNEVAQFSDWADSVRREFSGDPTKIGAPNPKQKIPTFTSFEDYRFHCFFAHDERMAKYIENPCKETSCLLKEDHGFWPHGDIKCKICSRGFKLKKDHDGHISSEHIDIESMNSNEIFELYQSEIY